MYLEGGSVFIGMVLGFVLGAIVCFLVLIAIGLARQRNLASRRSQDAAESARSTARLGSILRKPGGQPLRGARDSEGSKNGGGDHGH